MIILPVLKPGMVERIRAIITPFKSELGGYGHELNGHRCPCRRHGHGRVMNTKFLEKRGVVMDMKKSVKRGMNFR